MYSLPDINNTGIDLPTALHVLHGVGLAVINNMNFTTTILFQGINVLSDVSYIKTVKCDKTLEERKEVFYLTTHSTHFIYGYMASDIW